MMSLSYKTWKWKSLFNFATINSTPNHSGAAIAPQKNTISRVCCLIKNTVKRLIIESYNIYNMQMSWLSDAVGTKRYESNSGGEREIQRTMLELLNQLDGFDYRGDVKVIMATNRIETLDPALIRPG